MQTQLLPLLESARDLAGLLLLGLAAALWLSATRRLRQGPLTDRMADGFVALAWIGTVTFWPLILTGWFRLLPASVLLLSTGLVANLLGAGTRSSVSDTTPNWRFPSTRDRRLLLAVVSTPAALLATLRFLKGLATPPMAWDTLTYHLPKAAMWVQSGRFPLPDIPDAWSYYAWFPAAGEIMLAWLLLPTRSDILVGLFGGFVWLLIFFTAHRLVRFLGAEPSVAWLSALALATLPCVLTFMTSGYADNASLLLHLVAIFHVLQFHRDGAFKSAGLAAAALGLGVALKITGLVLALPVAALMAAGLVKHPTSRRPVRIAALVMLSLLPAFGYVHAWIHKGSPFYPSKAPVASSLPYHEGLDELASGRLFPPEEVDIPTSETITKLFWSTPGGYGHINFGLGGLVLALLTMGTLPSGLKRIETRPVILLLLLGALLTVALFAIPSTAGLRTVWIGVLGRLLVVGVGPLLLCTAILSERIAIVGLTIAMIGNFAHALPLGFSPAVARPTLAIAVLAAVAFVLARSLLRFASNRQAPLARGIVILLALCAFYVPWSRVRDQARFPIYRETGQGGSAFDSHGIHPLFPAQVDICEHLDDGKGKVLAVSPGWDGVGHTQYLYPLMGRRLEHRLTYVPITREGNDVHLTAKQRDVAKDERAWLERLRAEKPAYLVGIWPDTPERAWVKANPEEFELIPLPGSASHWLARLR